MTGPSSPAPELANLRDLGGLPAAGGLVTRHGMLFRSAVPQPGQAASCLPGLGVRTVLDLRHESEGLELDVVPGIGMINAGLLAPPDPLGRVLSGEVEGFGVGDLASMYTDFLEGQAATIGVGVTQCFTPVNLPILVHCHAGKDRTGLLIAMVLEGLGVERDAVVADYALTSRHWKPAATDVPDAVRDAGIEWDRIGTLFTAPPEALEQALTMLEAEHGSVAGYLMGPAGVSGDVLREGRAVLLEST